MSDRKQDKNVKLENKKLSKSELKGVSGGGGSASETTLPHVSSIQKVRGKDPAQIQPKRVPSRG